MPRRLFPVLLLLFAASGCAALIYEVVWLQLLQLVVGSTAVSMAVLLSAYMGGLCAGSYLLPRMVSPRQHPLRVYAFIELGIGVLGIAVLFLVPAGALCLCRGDRRWDCRGCCCAASCADSACCRRRC